MHGKYFICYIQIPYYIYYMNRIATSHDPLDDGWNDPSATTLPLRDKREVSLSCGDTVLYRAEGQEAPAKLVAPVGSGWLVRSARFFHELIYLAPESIILRLPRNDLRDEAV